MKFRKKPVVIEAELYDGSKESIANVLRLGKDSGRAIGLLPDCLTIKTLESTHKANVGDWIIKGVQGELYPCKPDIFERTYELEGDRPKIICLCGSSRFIESFAVLAWELEKAGNITVGLHYLPPSYSREHIPDHLAEYEGIAKQMDELHLRKIDLADEVFVININGYIGESTSREIDYATKLGKPIKYLEPVGQ